MASAVSKYVQAEKKESVRFEIITCEAERLCEDIMIILKQTATILSARGAYSAKEKKTVFALPKNAMCLFWKNFEQLYRCCYI